MTEKDGPVQAEAAFRAVLTPHRSLAPQGFVILMTAIGLVSFAMGAMFAAIGAWPVFGFFGLDVLLIYIAFRLNYRSGRAYETVELTPALLTLTRVDPSGRRQSYDFNPYWVRVRLGLRSGGRTDLSLASHGREFFIGQFLTDAEKRDFAAALQAALLAGRGGPRI